MTHAGFVTLVGKPNVGKSTLLNAMLESPVAPVSTRPQTTRRQLRGIYTHRDMQIVFVDAPGVHAPADRLDSYMQQQIHEALEEVDLVLWVVDLRHPPTDEDAMVAHRLQSHPSPVWLIGNKLDAATRPDDAMAAYEALLPGRAQSRRLSALDFPSVGLLRRELLEQLPEGPWMYPAETSGKSDQGPERWAGDMIRQAAMEHLYQEIPYTLAVKVETLEKRKKHKPKPAEIMYCKATLIVEREAHKPIAIGHGGSMLKRIGRRARQLMEQLLGRQVYLDLEVRVYPNWRQDSEALRELEMEQ
ncbi:MAG TPA: GTPase Era [Candidatus Xenobia bacterium]|jgi:GTP-binding protein Era